MPIYEYACRSCEHQFETIQKASEPALTDCPECGASALRKLLSAPVFRLKGSGWYETDFKTGDRKNVSDNGEADKGSGANGKSADAADSSTKEKGDTQKKGTQKADSKSSSSTTANAAKAD